MAPTSPRRRTLLSEGWSFLSRPAGAVKDPEGLPPRSGDPWLSARQCGTVAAMLRERGEWSLNGPPRTFDADDWWFACAIDLPEIPSGVAEASAVLGFDGLASLAEVWIDGTLLVSSASMFLAHQVALPLTPAPRQVDLVVCCRSVDSALARRRRRPRWRTPMVAHQQLRWIRTTLLGRTPGWTPPVAPVGPWRPVWLELPAPAQPDQIRLTARPEGDGGIIEFTAQLSVADRASIRAIRLDIDGPGIQLSLPVTVPEGPAAEISARAVLPTVARWWPHTHGSPDRYACSLHILAVDGSARQQELGAVGFRTVELDHSDEGFRLRVNGLPVFFRGACWTPLDPAGLQTDPDACRAELRALQSLGFNMLRITGALVYETPEFLAACDECGIMVWQDFMFANMDYPLDDPDFVRLVTEEARQALTLWRAHPCIAVLCGNSEASQQAAMWGTERSLWSNTFFTETLAALCRERCPGIPYWPSSAHGGSFPHQVDRGTTSYYGVGAYLRPLSDARQAGLRFATESLAFANVPEEATIARMPGGLGLRVHHPEWKARTPRDLNAGWDFEDVRDHYLEQVYGVDPVRLRYSDHARYLTLSRTVTGDVMAHCFAEWRRPGSPCGGALIWFLRDLWAGAGWGVLDDQGRAKACAHILAPRLQPTTAFLTDEGNNGLYAHVIHEGATELEAELEAVSFSAEHRRIWEGSTTLRLAPRSACTVPLMRLGDRFEDLAFAFRFGAQSHHVVGITLRAAGQIVAEDILLPGPARLGSPQSVDGVLQAGYQLSEVGTFEVLIHAGGLACHVHFIETNFVPPMAYFHLLPGREKRFTLPAGLLPPGQTPRGFVATSNSRTVTPLTRLAAAMPQEPAIG